MWLHIFEDTPTYSS